MQWSPGALMPFLIHHHHLLILRQLWPVFVSLRRSRPRTSPPRCISLCDIIYLWLDGVAPCDPIVISFPPPFIHIFAESAPALPPLVDRSIDLCIETNRDGIRDTLCTDLCISQGFRSLTSLASGNFSRIFHFTTGCHNCPARINTRLTQRLWTNEEQQDRDRTEWMKNREWTHTVELSPYNIGWGQGTGDSCGSHWCLHVLVMISKGWQWRGPD